MRKLKRAAIKEELVALTKDFKKAIVLNQMIYWSERRKDADLFFEEEVKRAHMAMGKEAREEAENLFKVDLRSHGWIYKSTVELAEETMIGASKSTMGRYLEELCENEWLERRKNPKFKGDNTYQYRVNLLKIQRDLMKLGYALEGYSFDLTQFQNETPKFDNETSEELVPESPQFQNETPKFDNETSEFQNRTTSSKIEQPVSKSNSQFQNETTLPEITSKITSKITSENLKEINISAFEEFWTVYPKKEDKKKAFEKFKAALKTHSAETIIQGSMKYAKQCVVQETERQFIKNPTTFLNAESFLNDFDLQPGKAKTDGKTEAARKFAEENGIPF